MFQQPAVFFGKPLSGPGPAQLKQVLDPIGVPVGPNTLDPASFLGALFESTCGLEVNLQFEADEEKRGSQVVPSNFVLDRDPMGRPVLWKIGGLIRQISYLPNGKIHHIEESGQLPPLATANGKPAFLLSFETHDGGRTYIGRFRSEADIEPIIMTKVDVRSDGTIVTADDSGLEMSWNPNNGEAAAAFVQRNKQQEIWIDHLDGTVTAELRFPNHVVAVLQGRQETEFCPAKILIESLGHSFEIVDGSQQGTPHSRVVVTEGKGKTVGRLEIALLELARLLMRACSINIGCHELESLNPSISIQDKATGAFVRLGVES